MITVEIFEDGSGLSTWAHSRAGITEHYAMSKEKIDLLLSSKCPNSKNGCGMCLVCATKQAEKEVSWVKSEITSRK